MLEFFKIPTLKFKHLKVFEFFNDFFHNYKSCVYNRDYLPYILKIFVVQFLHMNLIYSIFCVSLTVSVCELKVTRPSYFVRVASNFETLCYRHVYFDRKSNI